MLRRVGVALVLLAAAAFPVRADDHADLRRILDDDRAAHLGTDAALLASHLADTLVSVDAGRVDVLTRAEVAAFFTGYFRGAVYRAWDDLEPPRIRVSADGAMAWVVRRVVGEREEPAFGGGRTVREFTGAWTATYEKTGGTWRMTSVTSTFLPGRTEADRVLAAVRTRLGGGGGEAAAAAVTAVRAEAEVFGPGPAFTVAVHSARSGAVRIDWSLGFSGAIAPDTSWTRSNGAGSPLTPEVASLLRGHEAHMIALAPDTRYGPLAFSGRVDFEGVPALRLSGADPLGGPFEYLVAEEDSLPLGYVVADHAGSGESAVTVRFDQWRETGGLFLFHAARFRQGDEVFHYRYTALDPAPPADPDVFRRP